MPENTQEVQTVLVTIVVVAILIAGLFIANKKYAVDSKLDNISYNTEAESSTEVTVSSTEN